MRDCNRIIIWVAIYAAAIIIKDIRCKRAILISCKDVIICHWRHVHAGNCDGDRRRIKTAIAIADRIAKAIRGRIAGAKHIKLTIGIVIIRAIGIDRQQSAAGQCDLRADIARLPVHSAH